VPITIGVLTLHPALYELTLRITILSKPSATANIAVSQRDAR
jgi:hypothetical protein